jgi:hypothetical protein
MSDVRIVVDLTGAKAHQLYLFTKRVRFDQAFELTEGWKSKADRTDQAYVMIHAVAKVTDALLEAR